MVFRARSLHTRMRSVGTPLSSVTQAYRAKTRRLDGLSTRISIAREPEETLHEETLYEDSMDDGHGDVALHVAGYLQTRRTSLGGAVDHLAASGDESEDEDGASKPEDLERHKSVTTLRRISTQL